MTRRQKAIRRRRIFLSLCAATLVVAVLAVTGIVLLVKKAFEEEPDSPPSLTEAISSVSTEESRVESTAEPSPEDSVTAPADAPELDPDFSRLLLVNGDNMLPDNYDSDVRQYLVEIDPKYRNNDNVTQIHRDVYPYITAMVAAAQAEGVNLKVWSPFRSYAIQNDLFQKQVQRCLNAGTPAEKAEDEASTVVARPGTSEHNTGLCADFNMASDSFESTPMFTWMCEHAEDYGFILRYPKDAIDKTGVIYESWHWRFVGIKAAHEINRLGITLEEYVKLKKLDPHEEIYITP